MKKAFITGATGFVGAHLCFQLLTKGYKVKALRRNNTLSHQFLAIQQYYPQADAQDIEWVLGDISDYKLYEYCRDIDYIFHTAAMVSFEQKHRKMLLETNVNGTKNIVNVALKNNIKKLIYVSSVAAIGRAKKEEHINEDNEWEDSKNNTNYAVSKHLAEMEVWRGQAEGLNTVIVSPTVILGPSAGTTSSSAMIKQASKGIRFYTLGINGFVDVRDVCRSMILLCESPISGERFIVNGANISYQKLFTLMAKGFDKKAPTIIIKPWMAKLFWPLAGIWAFFTGKSPLLSKETAKTISLKCHYSSDKIINALNFEFIPIEKTIQNSCEFYHKIS